MTVIRLTILIKRTTIMVAIL